MNKESCSELQKKLILYALDELAGKEKMQIESHIQHCHSCQREYDETQNFVSSMHEDALLEPEQSSWDNLVEQAYQSWQQTSKSSIANAVLSLLSRWLKSCKNTYSIPLATATVSLLCILVLVPFWLSPQPDFSSTSFHSRYLLSDNLSISLISNDVSLGEKSFSLAFSMPENSNAFVIGENYAQTFQACLYRFESLCEKQVFSMNDLLDKFAYIKPDENQNDAPFILFSNKKQSVINQLQKLDEELNQSLSSIEAGQLLYHFGIWTHDMSFAASNQIDGIRDEKVKVEYLSEQAIQYNMAKGVISSLVQIRATLDLDRLEQTEYENLLKSLDRIKQIFR